MGVSKGDLFLAAMSLGYVAAGIAYLYEGNKGYALTLIAYAVANIGLVVASK